VDTKRTGTFQLAKHGRDLRQDHSEARASVVLGLGVPAALLDPAGIVVTANRAMSELLRVERPGLEGEPLLAWIRRPGDREAFGREFIGLRKRATGLAFVRALELRPQRGPAVRCIVRACKIDSGQVLVTSERAQVVDAETELGRSVTRALDGLNQGVFLVDGQGRIVHVNPAAQILLGEGLIGRGILELAAPNALESLGRGLALARNGCWYGELDLHRLDGEPVPVELSVAAGAGEGAPAVVLLRDLREIRRREFEERLVGQVDRALVGSIEPRDAVTAACRSLAIGLGAHRVVVLTSCGGRWERWEISQESSPIFTELPAGFQPPPAWLALDRAVLLDADAGDESEFGLGASNDQESGVRAVLRATGGIVGHLVVYRDTRFLWDDRDVALVAQLAPQLALGLANGLLVLETRTLAAYQSRVMDQTAVLLNSVDERGRVVTWNRASERLLGVNSGAATGRRFGVEVAPAVDPRHWDELWKTLLRDGVIANEVVLLDSDGEEVPIHLEGRVLREGKRIRGAVLVGLDLRVRRALEAQVLQSQKMAAVGLLAAGIAHEINNPLSGVVGYSTMLLEKQDLSPYVREKVQRISDSGERCRKIVEGVLLFSRSQQSGERRLVDLNNLVTRTVQVGEYQWKMHNVRIVRDADDAVSVMADEDQIEQVLLNLLSNAVDAMPLGGAVQIALRLGEEGGAVLSVSDEGSGIPEEIRDSIFDPFFSTKDIGKGTGLGLSISYGIVKDHGGDILLESRPGRGTTFTIFLPKDGRPLVPTDTEIRDKTR